MDEHVHRTVSVKANLLMFMVPLLCGAIIAVALLDTFGWIRRPDEPEQITYDTKDGGTRNGTLADGIDLHSEESGGSGAVRTHARRHTQSVEKTPSPVRATTSESGTDGD